MASLTALRWIASALLGLLGTWYTAYNYYCIVVGLSHRRHYSMIPFLGGMALASALLACPVPRVTHWAWVPLAADPGCLFAVALLGYAAIVTRGFRG